MKKQLIIAGLISVFALSTNAMATILQTWDLTNKSPGALGADYGLRLNQMDTQGISGSSNTMIFDFERSGYNVTMQLIDNAGDLELKLFGTAYGALFDSNATDGYGADFAGSYTLDFTWTGVQQNTGGFDFVAGFGMGNHSQGTGSGSVLGTGTESAFAAGLSIFDWSGAYTHTLDILGSNTPDASGWLTFGSNRHNGDFGFNMTAVVPEPAILSLIGMGLIGLALSRRKRS